MPALTAEEPFKLEGVPAEAVLAVWLHPQELMQDGEQIPQILKNRVDLENSIGFSLVELQEVQVLFSTKKNAETQKYPPPSCLGILKSTTPAASDLLLQKLTKGYEQKEENGKTFYAEQKNPNALNTNRAESLQISRLNSTTLIKGNQWFVQELLAENASVIHKATWTKPFELVRKKDIVIGFDTTIIRDIIHSEVMLQSGVQAAMFRTFSPLWEQTDSLFITLDAHKNFELEAFAICPDEAAAKKIQTIYQLLLNMGETYLPLIKEPLKQSDQQTSEKIYAALETMFKEAKVSHDGNIAQLKLSPPPEASNMMALVATAMRQSLNDARRITSLNNMKQLMLAMHNYSDQYKSFPPAVKFGPDSTTPHSWRVAILPYMGEEQLYKEYNQDEPWDSVTNKKVLAKMPDVFRSPFADPTSTNTSYFAITHPQGAFVAEPQKLGTSFRNIDDGMSKTLALVNAEREIPWTKPEDIQLGDKMPELGEKSLPVLLVAICDGSIFEAKKDLTLEQLLLLVKRNDGQVINMEDYHAR